MMKIKQAILLVGIGFVSVSNSWAQELSEYDFRAYENDDKLVPREHNLDFQHLKLFMSIEPEKGVVHGNVILDFKPIRTDVDSIWLDAVNMSFMKVELNGQPMKYTIMAKGIAIMPDEKLTYQALYSINIEYDAYPRKGLHFIGWNDPTNRSRKQIWSQGQGIDNRHWIPHYDTQNDKLITELVVTFDSKYKVLSNGLLLSKNDNDNNTTTWHYNSNRPHPSYLIMLGIGDYGIAKDTSDSGVSMNYYYYPDEKNKLEPTYRYSVELIDFFEKEIGVPYPWDSYSQIPVKDYMYGAMENTTATLFGDFYYVDSSSYLDHYYVGVNAHELAHQWFGDMVTARSATHHWLQESFATHYAMMGEGEVFGQDKYDWIRRDAGNQALEAAKHDSKPLAHGNAGTARWYPKGSVVLDMLKYVVGRDVYNTAVKTYLQDNAYENVDSEDLLEAFEESAGLSLHWFWDQWVYRGGEPSYLVTHSITDEQTAVTVKQVHEMNELVRPFTMPIVIEVHYEDGTYDSKKVLIDKLEEEITIRNHEEKEVAYILFDPNSKVLKTISYDKPFEMLEAQGLGANYMLDRYDAVVAMREIPLKKKQKTLLKIYEQETFWAVKGEVVKQLVNEDDKKSLALITKALHDEDVDVRKAAIENMKEIPKGFKEQIGAMLDDPSYEIRVEAMRLLTETYPESLDRVLNKMDGIEGGRGANVRMMWLKLALKSETRKEAALKELVDRTSESYEFITRMTAMNMIVQENYIDETVIHNLVNALFSSNNRLRGNAKQILAYYYRNIDFAKKIDHYIGMNRDGWERWQINRIDITLKRE